MAITVGNFAYTGEVLALPDGDADVPVRMIGTLTGTRNGEDWPPKGGTVVLPVGEARDLILARLAELVIEPEPVETATVTPPENAAVRRTPTKGKTRVQS